MATGDAKVPAVRRWNGLRTHLAQNRRLLRTLTIDNPDQQRRLDALDPLLDGGLADMVHIASVRQEKGLAAAQAAVQLNNQPWTEGLRSGDLLLTAMEDEERTLLDQRERTAQQDAQNSNQVILYGTLVGLGLAALIGVMMHISITRPLGEFQKFVTSVGAGDLTQNSALEGADELGKLGRGLNQMVARLRTMATQTRAATENLAAATMEILASAREQSAITGEQVAAYQQTNATMQEVSQSGMQISERAKQVTVTAEAVSIANTSGLDAVQKANQTVEAIHEQAEAVAQNIVALSEKTQMVGDILATE